MKTIRAWLLIFSIGAISFIPGKAQQKVNLSDINDSYTGGFFRVSAGIAPGKITYTDVLDSYSLTAVHFNILGGKRFGKHFAPYFHVYGNVLPKQTPELLQFMVAGMGLGSNLYFLDANTYFTPEAGLAVMMIEENGGNDYTDNLGACFTFRTGRDWHIAANAFAGVQVFFSYYFARDTDDEFARGNGTFYGVNLSLKLGK